MKLICSRESLLNSINIVLKAVSSRTTLPILECILLCADENGFKLTGNDLELGIESSPIEATIFREGTLALEAKIFSEIIRKVNGDQVSISSDENNMTIISCGSSEFKIMGQHGDDFPRLPVIEKNLEFILSQNELRNMIRQTIFSIAQDESKPILTGELIEIKNGKINIVSVDGYRISYKTTLIESGKNQISVVVPGKTLNEISKILSMEPEETVSIFITDKHILFHLGGSTIVSRLLEGEYIKYEQSFTEDYKTKIFVNCSALISSLERASLISRDSKKMPVKMEISSNSLIITSHTEMGTAYEEVEIEVDGEPLKIAFNPKYLIDALKAIDDEKVAIQFTTPLSPCIMKAIEGGNYKYLVLPLRI